MWGAAELHHFTLHYYQAVNVSQDQAEILIIITDNSDLWLLYYVLGVMQDQLNLKQLKSILVY